MSAEMNLGQSVEQGQKASNKRTYACVREKRTRTHKPAPRPCQHCEIVFTPKRENPKEPARCCSPKCRSALWRDEQKKDRRIEALTARIVRIESHLGIKGSA
jgi:hypothetical protein